MNASIANGLFGKGRIFYQIIFLHFFLISTGSPIAQEIFKVTEFRYNHVQNPKGFEDIVREFADSEEGSAIIIAGASYFGVPPQVTGTLIFAANSMYKKEGEDIRTSLYPDPGYKMCRARVVKKRSCNGPARFTFRVFDERIGIYSRVKREGAFKGKNWVDYDIRVLAVRDDYYTTAECDESGYRPFEIDC